MVMKTAPTYAQSVGLLLVRLPMGAMFFLAGLSKLTNAGLGNFVNNTLPAATKFLPENLGRMYLTALPFVEMTVGVLIAIGFLTRIIGVISSAMIVSFIVAVTGLASKEGPFHPNLIYLGITLLLVFCGAGLFSVDALLWPRRRVTTVVEEKGGGAA